MTGSGSVRFAASVAAGYAVIGIAWILFSDLVLHRLAVHPVMMQRLQSAKGSAFIVLTSIALFLVLWRLSVGRTRHLLARASEVAKLGGLIGGFAETSGFAAAATSALRRATGTARVVFMAADDAGEMLAVEVAEGFDEALVARVGSRIAFKVGDPWSIPGTVAQTRRPMYVADSAAEPAWLPVDPTLKSAYFTPVVQDQRLFGVLAVFSTEPDGFTPAQRSLADLVAGLAATGLAQARLAAEQRKTDMAYRELVEHSPAGIFRVGLDGNLLAANPAIATSTGYPDPAALLAAAGPDPGVMFADPSAFHRFMAELRAHGHVPLFEAATRGRAGRTRWMLMTARTVFGASGEPVHYEGTAVDITARRDAEAALTEARERLSRQERLSALGEMASIVAHDFNNALTPVQGYAELLEDGDAADPGKVAKYAGLIRRGAEDAAGIVRRLREFARPIRTPTSARISCRELLADVAEMARLRWRASADGRSGAGRIEVEAADVFLTGDAGALKQALLNLAFNAIDASPAGSTITLRATAASGRTVLEVADTGSGMTEEVRKRCLEPFFSTKAERGTGLGLASVHRIVVDHHGTLDIRSTPGEGSVFTLSFPAG